MACNVCGAPTGWVDGGALERANESKRAAMAECEELRAEVERLRGIVPEVLERLNDELCAENDRLRAALREVLEFQSDPKAPTIHDFGRWRRAADGLKA